MIKNIWKDPNIEVQVNASFSDHDPISRHRVGSTGAVGDINQSRAAILEAQVNAALAGHDLGAIRANGSGDPEIVGYQAACR